MSSKPSPSPFLLIGMGLSVAMCIAIGVGGGYLIGNAIGQSVLFIFVGLGVGLVAAVGSVRAQIKRYM